jgi:rare lipoprotein A
MNDISDDWANAVGAGAATLLLACILGVIVMAEFACYSFAFGAEMRGIASVYSYGPLACGGRFNRNALEAAHKTLPCGTRVMVQHGSRTVVVRIVDRGPYVKRRIIDLTPAAAREIGISGLGEVTLQVVDR